MTTYVIKYLGLMLALSVSVARPATVGTTVAGTLSGYVLDAGTGEGLPGANIFLKGTTYGAATNIDGYYVIVKIPEGEYELTVSYIGFKTLTVTVAVVSGVAQRRDFELETSPLEVDAIEVTANRTNRKLNNQISRVKLSARTLKSVPQIGEADLMRTIQMLPGVLTPSEFSTGLVIRGGNTDQNLILFDGITVYNPSHLGGLFSNFIVDAIKEADLHKGGFNVEYGDRLSAVLDVTSREGNRKHFDGRLSISLLSAQSTMEGPVGNGAWLIAGRRTYFDQIFKGTELYFPYYFYDLQGHIFQDIGENDRLSVSWYIGRDDLNWEAFELNAGWGNRTISARYRHLFGAQMISNLLVATSRFDTKFGLGGENGLGSENVIDDFTVKSDLVYFASQKLEVRIGTEVKKLSFTYGSSFLDTLIDVSQTPTEIASFIKLKNWVTPRLMLEPGFRLTYYTDHGQKWYYDPRFRAKFLITDDQYINAAVGIYHQFMETAQDDYNPSILDQWFAVDSTLKPAVALQLVLGYEAYFKDSYRFQVETYYKRLENLLTFVQQGSTSDEGIRSSDLIDLFDMNSGYAYGLELFLQKTTGKLNGWISYANSTARKQYLGKEYYVNWDRRHAVNVISNYNFSTRWAANLAWKFQTGQPYTPIFGYYIEQLPYETTDHFRTIPGGRNSVRYPAYHRLDLGLIYNRPTKWGSFEAYFQVVNAYYKKNIFRYFYLVGDVTNGIDDDNDGEIDEIDESIPRRESISIFPILPSFGFTIEF